MASGVLGTIGTAIGGPIGGFIGSAIGGMIDAYIFSPNPEDTQGPRIGDTRTSGSDPGMAIPVVYGADRIGSIVIGLTDLKETKNVEKVKVGKKSHTSTTYTYSLTADIMICEGPILGVGRIWSDGKLIRGTRKDFNADPHANRFKVGFFPYPDFYREPARMYDPALLPWTNDAFKHPNTNAARWRMVGDNLQLMTEKEWINRSGEVIYWRDLDTGYFLPDLDSTGYQRAKAVVDALGNPIDADASTEPYPSPFAEDPYRKLFTSSQSDRHGEWTLQALYPEHADFPPNAWRPTHEVAESGTTEEPNEVFAGWINTHGHDVDKLSTYGEQPFSTPVPEGYGGIALLHKYVGMNEAGGPVTRWKHVAYYFRTYFPEHSERDFGHYYNLYAALNDWSPLSVFQFSNPENVTLYRGTAWQPPDPTMEVELGEKGPGYLGKAHIVFHNLELEDFGNRLPSFSFEVVRYENETIKTTIVDLLERAGVEPQFYDVSELSDVGLPNFLPGYSVATRTNYRKSLEPLLEAFDIDVAEIGQKIKFRKKSRPAEHIINYSDLGAHDINSKTLEPAFRTTRRDPKELPRVIETAFKDPGRAYQKNTMRQMRGQEAQYHNVVNIELPVVAYPQVMKAWTMNKLRETWEGRMTTTLKLPPRYIKISPTDVVRVVTTEQIGTEIRGGKEVAILASVLIKVQSVQRGLNGNLEVMGVVRNGSRYPLEDNDFTHIDVPMDYVTETKDNSVTFTELAVLDIPALDASHSGAGVYAAVSDRNDNKWMSARIMVSNSKNADYGTVATSNIPAVIGTVIEGSLANVNPAYIDTESDVIVRITSASATVSSVTLSQMLNFRANMALIGREVLAFTSATYLGERKFRLHGSWLRGLRGTDDAVRMNHLKGEQFVLLDSPAVDDLPRALEEINTDDYYKAVSSGINESATPSSRIIYRAERLKPFAPVHLTGDRNSGNDLTIRWTRRDRLFHKWMSNVDLPMSEATLAYQVDIYFGQRVVRTIDCSTEQATYTAVQQTADGLTPGDAITVVVYQMSALVGRGHGAQGVV